MKAAESLSMLIAESEMVAAALDDYAHNSRHPAQGPDRDLLRLVVRLRRAIKQAKKR